MLPPRLTARWAAAQIKDLVATKTPHNNHSPITLHVALCLLDFLQRKEPRDREGKAVPYKRYIDDPNFRGNLEAILERLEAQETTSPLELGASIMQAYSQTRFNWCCCNLGREPRKLRFYCVINAMCLCCQAVSNTRLTITASGFG